MKCNFCSTETELFFCPNCGKIIEYPQFIKGNAKLEKELTDYVQSLVYEARSKKLEVQEFVDKGTIAKEMFRKYYEHCLYLQELCANKRVAKSFASNGVSLFDTMMGFAQKCNNNECQIAVVGTVKAGKSMFINAILGREVASSYPTPETASLTKFRYSADGDYVKVSFYTKDEWTQLWNDVQDASKKSFRGEDDKDDFLSKYEELKAEEKRESLLDKPDEVFKPNTFEELQKTVATYSSCQYAEHFFAKEVEVGLSVFDVPQNVVFVDTPGLNDPVKFRSDISRKYINSANVVLLCISADKAAIESTELEQTATIFSALRYAKDRIYIFGTKIDMQSNFMDFWETYTKPEFVKYFSKKYLSQKKTSVTGFSMECKKGEITGLLGLNGAGKTTILKAVCARHFATEGEVLVENIDAAESPDRVRNLTGFVQEEPNFPGEYTVQEFLHMVSSLHGMPVNNHTSSDSSRVHPGLASQLSLEEILHKKIKTLSLEQSLTSRYFKKILLYQL